MGDFKFQCICCNTAIEVGLDQVGYVVYCPKCMAELIVPDFESQPPDVDVDVDVEEDEVAAQGTEESAESASEASVDVPPGTQKARPSSGISQVIYRDADGNPIIPDDVVQALTDDPGALDGMTDTKLALAETLRALQANQQALAEARKELAARRHASDTNHVKISDTSNELIREDYEVDTSQYNEAPPEPEFPEETPVDLGEQPLVIVPKDQETEEIDPMLETQYTQEEEYYHGPVEFVPLYTPHGDFLPFTEADFDQALANESDALFEAIAQIRPTPQCWSYSVFALILETHIARALPEVLPVVPLTGVFFGGTPKYLDEVNKQYVVFANIMRRMVKTFGEEFQHALMQHDIYAYVEVVQELDQPMEELAQFMVNFQHIAMPKKEPFLRLRELIIKFYDDVRHNLMKVVDRLDERSELTPEHAKMGTVSVSLMPPDVHEFALLMTHFTYK